MFFVVHRVQGHVVGETDVRARVWVGATQRVIWTMTLGVDPVKKGTDAAWVDLGDGKSLRGNHLDVSAVVMDVSDAAEELTCTVEVEGTERTTTEMRWQGGHGNAAALSVAVLFR